jgi:hypothetical protein
MLRLGVVGMWGCRRCGEAAPGGAAAAAAGGPGPEGDGPRVDGVPGVREPGEEGLPVPAVPHLLQEPGLRLRDAREEHVGAGVEAARAAGRGGGGGGGRAAAAQVEARAHPGAGGPRRCDHVHDHNVCQFAPRL